MPRTIKGTGGGKRYPLSMRTTKETRERLEAEAAASGRSLAQEVEARLERTLSEDVLDRLLRDPSYRTMALLVIEGLRRGGERGAEARGHPEWGSAEWFSDSFTYRCAGYAAMDALGMGEPREPLPPEPSLEEFKAQHKAYARAVAAGDEIKIPPYPHPRERKPS